MVKTAQTQPITLWNQILPLLFCVRNVMFIFCNGKSRGMRIIKRRRGTTDYFYLQHSHRRNGKVITKERYLGKKIPPNIEEIKAKLLHDAQDFIVEKLEKIRSNFQKEWQTYPQSAKDNELKELAISFTYNTNAIEGSTITQQEARLILEDQVAPNKPLKDIKETEAHAKVFLEMLKTQPQMSQTLLLKWHEEIFHETKPDIAGKCRQWPVKVGPYLAPDWQTIEKFMDTLMKFVNESTLNPVDLAVRAHYIFEKIHPFGDGNGRIGRLLMNHIVWKNGYPTLIIEYTKRKNYYRALQQPEEGFRNYLIRRYLATHKKHLE
jgi:Fic family protein